MGGGNWCVGDQEWYLTGPYILCLDFRTEIVSGTKRMLGQNLFGRITGIPAWGAQFGIIKYTRPFETIISFKSPSSPLMYPIQLSYCQGLWCLIPLFMLAQLCYFPHEVGFKIIECFVDVFNTFSACNLFLNKSWSGRNSRCSNSGRHRCLELGTHRWQWAHNEAVHRGWCEFWPA